MEIGLESNTYATQSLEGGIHSTSLPKHLLRFVRALPLDVRLAKVVSPLLGHQMTILPKRCRIEICYPNLRSDLDDHEVIRMQTMHRANPSPAGPICTYYPMNRETVLLVESSGMHDLAMGQR